MDTNLFGSKELFNKHGFVLLKNILSEEDSEFIKKKLMKWKTGRKNQING